MNKDNIYLHLDNKSYTNKAQMQVRELRKSTRMSQSKFAKYYGIPLSTLQDWEHDRRKPAPYIPKMMQRILELEKEVDKKEKEIAKILHNEN